MALYYEDAPDFTTPERPHHHQQSAVQIVRTPPQVARRTEINKDPDRYNELQQQRSESGSTQTAQWALTNGQTDDFTPNPNLMAPSIASSIADLQSATNMSRPGQPSPAGTRTAQLRLRYEQLKLHRDKEQLKLDKLDDIRVNNPQQWTDELVTAYHRAERKKHEAEVSLGSLRQCLRRLSNQTQTQTQTERPRYSANHTNRFSQASAPRPARTPDYGRNAQRRRSYRPQEHDPYAVLRQHEVPVLDAYHSINTRMIGTATGLFHHANSTTNAVSAGGYPLPDLAQQWFSSLPHLPQTRAEAPTTTPFHTNSSTLHQPDPTDPIEQWHKAIHHFTSTQYAPALDLFKSILTHPSPSIPLSHIYYNIGILYFLLSDPASATTAFTNALHHNPGLIIAHYCLGILHYKSHHLLGALRSFETASNLFEATYQTVNYQSTGLALVLQKTQVNFARDLCVRGGLGGYQEIPMFRVDVLFEPVEEGIGRLMPENAGGKGGWIKRKLRKWFGVRE